MIVQSVSAFRPVRPAGLGGLHRTASILALSAGMMGLAGLATPAAAQCVEGVPGEYTCSGDVQVGQTIVGDDTSATTTAGFAVDTTLNGNGLTLSMTGDGRITYTDVQASSLTGAGVSFVSTGASGLDAGSVQVFSDGAIVANGAQGLRVENAGGGDTAAVWLGPIVNTGGAGVFMRDAVGSGDLNLVVGDINASDDAIRFDFHGSGLLGLTALGPIVSGTGSGLRIEGDTANGDYNIELGDVTGGAWGVLIDNDGVGATRLVSTGTITGLGQAGITLNGGAFTTDIDVTVDQVNGETYGLQITNAGTGSTTIVASGTVAASTLDGIVAVNDVNTDQLSITATDVFGRSGIIALNYGAGATQVVSTGLVAGFEADGVRVQNDTTATDVLIDVNDVVGGNNGINVVNFGSGLTRVISDGVVTGGAGNGVAVQTGTASQSLVVEVSEVHGQDNGVLLNNVGSGVTVLAATGDISAVVGSGIRVDNGFGTTEVQIDVAAVAGGDRGIWASSEGLGGVYVNATGPVSGDDIGILAEMGAAGANVIVNAVDVFSAGNGIVAANDGDGLTRIVSTGTVVGTDQVGIRAFGGAASFNVVVDANNASGGFSGVSAVSFGLGSVEITTRGVVQGGSQGVEGFSDTNGVNILNEGVIRNSSGLSSDRAILASGAFVVLENQGTVTGELAVIADASLFVNEGVWNTAGGTSQFEGGDDAVFNNEAGTVIGGGGAGIEVTLWSGLEFFNNRGLLRMADGGAGDRIDTSANALFEGTSVLTVDIGGAGASDLFRTTGTVEIEPGSTLTVNRVQPLVLNSQYVVVDAAGGLTGQFDFDDQMLTAFAGLRDGYTANTAYVEFVQLKALADAALTPNQAAAAEGADSLTDGNPLKDALVLLPTEAAAQDAFDQVSGEIHPAVRTALAEDSRLPRGAVLDRLGYGEPERSVWGRVFGAFGSSDGDSNAAEFDRDSHGMIFGVDKTFGALTVGVAAGGFETEVKLGARRSEATVDSIHGLAYAGGQFEAWGVRGGVGYAFTSTETKRDILFPGFAEAARADYDGSVLQGFVEVGYRLSVNGGHVEPFVGLTALQVKTDAFTERGGDAALAGRSKADQTAVSTLGARFETNPDAAYSLRGSAGWRHSWGDLDPIGVHAFEGGDAFRILGASQSADAAFANVEARWKVSPAATFGIAYDGVVGVDGEDHAVTGSLRVVF